MGKVYRGADYYLYRLHRFWPRYVGPSAHYTAIFKPPCGVVERPILSTDNGVEFGLVATMPDLVLLPRNPFSELASVVKNDESRNNCDDDRHRRQRHRYSVMTASAMLDHR